MHKKGRLRLVTDYANYQYLIKQFEEKEKDSPMFIFNVTMQNHSGYSSDYNFADRITLNEYDSEEYLNAEVYLSLMKQSDSAFKYLIEYFEQVEEPTIIVNVWGSSTRRHERFSGCIKFRFERFIGGSFQIICGALYYLGQL